MHAADVTLEYPMSATAKGDFVLLSSWFTGTVQLIDRKSGKTIEMLHGFKAPHDAVRLGDGSILVNELGTKSLVRASGGGMWVSVVREATSRPSSTSWAQASPSGSRLTLAAKFSAM